MTDIRRHFPVILSCIHHYLAEPGPSELLITKLRALLPASYGIGAGSLVTAHGQRSRSFDVVIYDKTLTQAQQLEPASDYDPRLALVVIRVARELATQALQHLLQDIASAKMLLPSTKQPSTKAPQKPARTFKQLLPLGVVACQRFTDAQSDDPATLALMLDAYLKSIEERLRPDYLIAQSLQLAYSNPLLAGNAFVPTTINIAREPALKKARPCYVCKQRFTALHFFYEYLCLPCGDFNYHKRTSQVNLAGRVALVTGGRVKIGYATALRLLRAGAQVIVTTRFPHDAARRYSSEPDFADWRDRLQIYGLDFRYLPVLEHFVAHLYATYPALDILINNAAQTVRHAQEHYAPLLPFGESIRLIPD
ncbi:MAG TPA: SDR family NAD(P)-dependent oxidoreductase [Ktedonosporobacter sp.]|jgi:hypothetical protein|nr:SDR family NAD(P)-dependent oxidoreductase [Ktedonosporobacter sp.]